MVLRVAAPAYPQLESQSVSVGVKGGVPVTNSFTRSGTGGFSFATKRYTVGPTVEVHLPKGLGVEVDTLYKRLSFDSSTTGLFASTTSTRANAWEFPLLLKIRPGGSENMRFYLAPGENFRHGSGLKEVREFFVGGSRQRVETNRSDSLENSFTAGFAIGAGVEFRMPYIRVAPEFRYTRWGWENFRDFGNLFRSRDDQAEVLVGITF